MSTLFVVGENGRNELVLQDHREIAELTACNLDFIVKEIHTTMTSSILVDINDNIWITGYEQLNKLTYFEEHNIKINKISCNTSGNCIFYISDDQKAYGTSYDHRRSTNNTDNAAIR